MKARFLSLLLLAASPSCTLRDNLRLQYDIYRAERIRQSQAGSTLERWLNDPDGMMQLESEFDKLK